MRILDPIWTEGKRQRSPSLAPTPPIDQVSGKRSTLSPVNLFSSLNSMKRLASAALIIAVSAHAADKPFKPSEAKTSKPDLLGQTRTELRDARGQKIGEAVTTKPNLLGDTRTVVRDSSGKTLGEAVTRKPNLLGESKTTFKDARGATIGEGVTTKPNLLGETKTRFKDPAGRTLGEAVTTKPNLLGETKTRIQGGTPWNPGTSGGKSSTTLPSTNQR